MSQQARLDVLWPQRFLQQRIIEQINLTDRQIVGSAPVAVQQVQVIGIRQLIVLSCRSHLDPSGTAFVSTGSKANRSVPPRQKIGIDDQCDEQTKTQLACSI